MKKIKIHVNNQELEFNKGIRLEFVADKFQEENGALIVAAKVDNALRELSYRIDKDSKIEFIDLKKLDGVRIYQRSLTFVMLRAAMELFEDIRITVEHSLNKGLYFEYSCKDELTDLDIKKLKAKMCEIIEADEIITKTQISKDEARDTFERFHMDPKVQLLKYREFDYINIYALGWMRNYFYGYMVPSTKYLKKFDIKKYDTGIILMHPTKFSPNALPEYIEQPKLATIYKESKRWGKILDTSYVANLNDCISKGEHGRLIRVSEALHEKKVAQIADIIFESKKRLVLIAGPSSSGKTTFANRLLTQLTVNGLKPITISTDDYFVNRENTPIDENGDFDFESIEAVNVELFNENLTDLLAGKKVDMPTFNFKTGQREFNGRTLQITADQPIIIEGIHGLNEVLTSKIEKKDKFKIYISALTQLNIDDHNRVPTTDTRLIRRIVRDSKYRGHSAETTMGLWPSVRRGEEKNIFPYQEGADIMFNSALVYELAILKKHAEPLLNEISEDQPSYSEAKRLLKFLSYFISIEDDNHVPYTSILKEFIGGSAFE